jgi:cytochrome c551
MRLIGLLFSALLVAACGGPSADASGAEVYDQVCARCHGADLEGRVGPALGPGSNAASAPDEYLYTTIQRGRGSMPSFSRTLDEGQIDRVVSYLRAQQDGP